MSWASITPNLAATVAMVPEHGQIYVGQRGLPDEDRIRELFTVPTVPGEDREELVRGCIITRESIRERWWSNLRSMAVETYTLEFIEGVADGARISEPHFQEFLDAFFETLRNLTSLGDAAELTFTAGNITDVGTVELGTAYFCHMARVSLEVTILEPIPTVLQPPTLKARGESRDRYSAVAQEIAAYLDMANTGARIHTCRPFSVYEAENLELFAPLTEDPDARVHAWRVYRAGNVESRGVGRLITAAPAWKLNLSRSFNEHGSASDFENNLDAHRAIFRGVASIGSTRNRTMAVSDPLQVTQIDIRQINSHLVHVADCELPVIETVLRSAA